MERVGSQGPPVPTAPLIDDAANNTHRDLKPLSDLVQFLAITLRQRLNAHSPALLFDQEYGRTVAQRSGIVWKEEFVDEPLKAPIADIGEIQTSQPGW